MLRAIFYKRNISIKRHVPHNVLLAPRRISTTQRRRAWREQQHGDIKQRNARKAETMMESGVAPLYLLTGRFRRGMALTYTAGAPLRGISYRHDYLYNARALLNIKSPNAAALLADARQAGTLSTGVANS